MTRSWSNQTLYILSPCVRRHLTTTLPHLAEHDFLKNMYHLDRSTPWTRNSLGWAVKILATLGTITMIQAVKQATKTLGEGRQCEILHNVARHFTQNVTYTVLIREKWWKECQWCQLTQNPHPNILTQPIEINAWMKYSCKWLLC